jgi:hypothetical protein
MNYYWEIGGGIRNAYKMSVGKISNEEINWEA